MRVIIVGAGEVGYQVAKFLTYEGVDVVIIDRDGNRLRKISEELDIATIEAEGSDPSAFKEAGADKADLLLAVTNSDETNMIACLLGKAMFNIKRKIARIRNPDYYFNKELLGKANLDIDPAINPELEAAEAVSKLIENPFASEIVEFEQGKIKVIGFKIPQDSFIKGKKLKSLRAFLNRDFIIGAIERDENVLIPTGEDFIHEGDIVYMPIPKEQVQEVAQSLGVLGKPAKKIMILGGGRLGYYIASKMETRADIKIIEKDAERCKFLSKHLGKSLILHGDGADKQLLIEENISNMDIYIACSNNDELNIMASLLAKKLGVKKVISIINRTDYISLAHNLGIQSVLSPRLITASIILRYLRRGEVLSLTAIAENKAEIIEIVVTDRSSIVGRTLKEGIFPRNSILGAIIRDDKIIIPSGNDIIRKRDKLIIFALKDSIREIEKLLT
ncbi:MAG: Trk system potassium transporter TrkA [Thermodesulfovibrio sp.]|uniref:Trk system potassium transporter TrkA n=2 Tax=unclassified Thermodesulfovibrio TaxID=2645936 RepID=UPI0024828478|nr:Trk system potassium transporter TrkA [Thermodesulfovibrio sp. 1176]MDI1471891.1 Trk system potassium transporter TrkA [Thermodesulfovibrio sp. 1176]MDI6714962.1 Trk system potassium transporter TrkA [Thermodesulfovibrio sp.]